MFPQRKPFRSPKERLPKIIGSRGCTAQYDMSLSCNLYSDGRWRFFPLGLGSCSFACGASVCHFLFASLCNFLSVVFCISLHWVAEGVQVVVSPRNMGVSCKHSWYGIFLHWHLESRTSESCSVFAFVKIPDFDAGEHCQIKLRSLQSIRLSTSTDHPAYWTRHKETPDCQPF